MRDQAKKLARAQRKKQARKRTRTKRRRALTLKKLSTEQRLKVKAFEQKVTQFNAVKLRIAMKKVNTSATFMAKAKRIDALHGEDANTLGTTANNDEPGSPGTFTVLDTTGGLIGGTTAVLPKYPLPTLPQQCSDATLTARQIALQTAQIENFFNFEALNGAVVHGNMEATKIKQLGHWVLRGTASERAQYAQELDFGVNDADPGEDAIDILSPILDYLSHHFWDLLWHLGIGIIDSIIQIVQILIDNLMDPDFNFDLEVIDPILVIFPPATANDLDDLHFFPDDPEHFPLPPYINDFRDDDLIAWLQLAPHSPVHKYLKPYHEPLDNFPISNLEFTKTWEFANDDLATAIAQNRVFIVDYSNLDGHVNAQRPPITTNYGARLYAPIMLLAIPKNSDQLKVIAIQPTQRHATDDEWSDYAHTKRNDDDNPFSRILTPKDDYWAWQIAKNTVTTIGSMSSVLDHLSTHVYLGPIPVSFYRNIPNHHPLAALLDVHLMSLVQNNFTGIFSVVGTNIGSPEFNDGLNGLLTGAIERLSGFSSETFLGATVERAGQYDFFGDSTPLDRDTDSEFSNIADYPLHDDNKTLPVIKNWVQEYINLYYQDDQSVIGDYELQAFLSETCHLGQVNGFPDHAASIVDLVDICSHIIYWMSVNHALDRVSSFQYIGALGCFDNGVPIPGKRYKEKDWFKVMPPINVGMSLFLFSRIFVDLPVSWHRSLGKFPQGQFMHDPRITPHLHNFQNGLFELNNALSDNNENRRWGFDLRMPSTLTVSPWN